MRVLTSSPDPGHVVSWIADVWVLADSIAQRASDLLLPWVTSPNQEKTPQSEWYIDPCAAINPKIGDVIDHESDSIPFSFETTEMLGTTWFRFHGTNAEGKGFMVSWPILGNILNIKHVIVDPSLRWGFWKKILMALGKHALTMGARKIYATFAELFTTNLFRKNGFEQVLIDEVPQNEQNPLMIYPDETFWKKMSKEVFDFHYSQLVEMCRGKTDIEAKVIVQQYYQEYNTGKLPADQLEDKQMIMCLDLPVTNTSLNNSSSWDTNELAFVA